MSSFWIGVQKKTFVFFRFQTPESTRGAGDPWHLEGLRSFGRASESFGTLLARNRLGRQRHGGLWRVRHLDAGWHPGWHMVAPGSVVRWCVPFGGRQNSGYFWSLWKSPSLQAYKCSDVSSNLDCKWARFSKPTLWTLCISLVVSQFHIAMENHHFL